MANQFLMGYLIPIFNSFLAQGIKDEDIIQSYKILIVILMQVFLTRILCNFFYTNFNW